MKKQFSPEALAIWTQITGSKGFLSSNRTQSLVDILNRELGLAPTMIRYGKDFEPADLKKYRVFRNRAFPDDHCSVYFHPDNCAKVTGSGAHNWLQWASKLLGYGRKGHRLAPRMKPPTNVAVVMADTGQKTGITRFLTLELVIFYLAVQTRTWGKPNRVLSVKDLIEKNDIAVVRFLPPTADAINVDDLFPSGSSALPSAKPKTRVPKAGQALVGYNPLGALEALEALRGKNPLWVSTLLQAAGKAKRNIVNGPIEGIAVDPELMIGADKLDDDGLEAHIRYLQFTLQERRAKALKVQFAEEASKAIIIHGESEVWPDCAEYATMTVRYDDGTEVKYYHQKLMGDQLDSAADEDLEVGDLLAD